MTSPTDRAQYLRGLVDMGSNGIRFSITDLSPPTARIMPTLYQDRAGISLYDAQYAASSTTKSPIPASTIASVLSSMLRFKRTCADFGVPDSNIRVLATEATREAVNSVAFREEIKEATGWVVEMLSKEEEGRVGAMGVASSFRSVDGLVMDLGGGSTQLTWMEEVEGEVTVGAGGSVSLPYGAAALTRRLDEAQSSGRAAVEALTQEVEGRLLSAFHTVAPHRSNTTATSSSSSLPPFPLFLSGGGFRGWGNVLLSTSPITPYPIPIINGFSVPVSSFSATTSVSTTVSSTSDPIFRVSARRASQIPAVAFLISCLTRALGVGNISRVRFCQGGVREGAVFADLPKEIRAQAPISVATMPYAPPSAHAIHLLLSSATTLPTTTPPLITSLLPALSNTLYAFLPQTKETRAAVALRSTTTGILAGVHGLSHEERAALALMLCERWGGKGELAPTDEGFFEKVVAVVGGEVGWWCGFVGRVAGVVGEVWPAGRVGGGADAAVGGGAGGGGGGAERLRFNVRDTTAGLQLHISLDESTMGGEEVAKAIAKVEKSGKRKNWVGGKEGWGMRVDVFVGGGVGGGVL